MNGSGVAGAALSEGLERDLVRQHPSRFRRRRAVKDALGGLSFHRRNEVAIRVERLKG